VHPGNRRRGKKNLPLSILHPQKKGEKGGDEAIVVRGRRGITGHILKRKRARLHSVGKGKKERKNRGRSGLPKEKRKMAVLGKASDFIHNGGRNLFPAKKKWPERPEKEKVTIPAEDGGKGGGRKKKQRSFLRQARKEGRVRQERRKEHLFFFWLRGKERKSSGAEKKLRFDLNTTAGKGRK